MLDLDQMKAKWEEHDRKLEASIRLNHELLRETRLSGARSALQRMTARLFLETLRFSLPAAVADLFVIAMLAATIRQIAAARQVDCHQPATAIQRQLENLRLLRIRTTQRGLLAGVLVWAPFAIWLSRKYSYAPLLRDSAGHNLNAALASLAGLSAFEEESR